MSKIIQAEPDTPNALLMEAMIQEMPLRAMLITGEGPFNRERLEALLDLINGRYFTGMRGLFKAMLNR